MAKAEPKNIALVSPDDVQQYLRTRRAQFDAKKNLAEVHGRTKVEFQEETGLNKTAIAFAERLDRFSPEVRQDVLRSLDKLREAMGPVWSQEETEDMFPDRTPEEQVEAFAGERAAEKRRGRAIKDATAKDERKQQIKDDLAAMRAKKQQAAEQA